MPIYLSNRQRALPINEIALKRRLGRLLRELGLAGAELSVSLVGDEEMRALNRRYRRRDRPANVLSFPQGEGGFRGGPPRALGDVVVSTETLLRETGEPGWAGFSAGDLLYFHLVHGLTHLLGYDHERGPAEAARQEAETGRLWGLIRHSL
ncbi:MAG: rRNA maturation RNase YbeY [Candidatus Adiutrix sp.]|jgi:rRNA maturation RNase YbeY|nr:rRNA maturation RNase YbeY [Candidatus Adiutrix sp.]